MDIGKLRSIVRKEMYRAEPPSWDSPGPLDDQTTHLIGTLTKAIDGSTP